MNVHCPLLLCVATLTVTPAAQDRQDAERVLRRTLHALSGFDSLSYLAEWVWHEPGNTRTSNPATVTLARNPADAALPFRIRIAYSSGTTVVWADGVQRGVFPRTRRLIVEPRGAAGLIAGGIYYTDMLEPNLAYDSRATRLPRIERILDTAVSLGAGRRETIGGVPCEVIAFELPPNQLAIESLGTIWVGEADAIPRKYLVRFREGSRELGYYMLTLKDLRIDPVVPPETFLLAAPEGYQEIVEPDREYPPRMGRPVGAGEPAPAWELRGPEGSTHRLADARGSLVLLDFWGTWCVPCLRAMPGIQELHQRFRAEGLRVYGLSCLEKDGARPAEVMAELGCDYQLLLDADAVAAAYGVTHYPTLVLIDREGNVRSRHVGSSPERLAELAALIEDLLR